MMTGIADLVITEDSDLLAFGCHRVFFKMDQHGAGVLIEWDKVYLSLGGRAEFFNIEKYGIFGVGNYLLLTILIQI